ncbi:hypothetical protein ACFLYF_03020, partial [Chloroflexota bacterium]
RVNGIAVVLRRDVNPLVKEFMKLVTKPKEIRPGLISSIAASYTPEEIREILKESRLEGFRVNTMVMGLVIKGVKAR